MKRKIRKKNPLPGKLAECYYWLRKKRGRPPVSLKRRELLQRVYPDRNPEDTAREQDEKRLLQILLCLSGSLVVVLLILLAPSGELVGGRYLARPSYGEGERQLDLQLEMGDETFPVQVEISSRKRTAEQRQLLLEEAEDDMKQQVLGLNPSLEEVSEKLDFQAECRIAGVTAFWRAEDPSFIGPDGSLEAKAGPGESLDTALFLTLTYDGEKKEVKIPITLVEAVLPEIDGVWKRLEAALAEANQTGEEEPWIELPEEIDSQEVRYSLVEDSSRLFGIAAAGVILAIVLFYRADQRLKEAAGKRDRELELDYSELVTKLTVLVGAGLTVRGAWEKIALDYQETRKWGRSRREAYEELCRVIRALGQGRAEGEAYGEFGRRCGLRPYLRLAGLLETNGKTGTKGLTVLLQAEVTESFQNRLQLAKRQGEEISSKLLLPMLMLFGLVLALLILPAFLAL